MLVILVILMAGEGWGAPAVESNSLKQLCEDDAKELFKKETGKMKLDKRELTYSSHYNLSLKNCFMMIKISTDLTIPEPPPTENLSYDFYDVTASSKIGSFLLQLDRKSKVEIVLYCHVSKQECHSLAEWKNLVKSFMEE